ncbi:hypothetical protein QEH32_gp11 [Corynebacterium phage EmiRose]|uniref:Uncharacterized protein n=1 Tax=Corynebacterium phage EmiRose TaxID=2565372 RepID=A0A649VRE6_9CAUD|nr:hypothetical protein QEH32_gp11 [Corynebacterium phage EmiRose]QGJ94143.1 hypothetical protein SEA_EMIROSE_11 [Corynebacterium phage EmiRose]
MEPKATLLDLTGQLVAALRSMPGGEHIVTELDAAYTPSTGIMTTLRATSSPASRLTRRVHSVEVTLVTFAPTRAEAWEPHHRAVALILDNDRISPSLRVSSPRQTTEATPIPGGGGPQWPGLMSRLSLTIREEITK